MMKKELNEKDMESINQLNCLIKELETYRDIIGVHGNKKMVVKLSDELLHVLQGDVNPYTELSEDVVKRSLSAIRKININLVSYVLRSLANQISEQNEEDKTTFTLTLPSLVYEVFKIWTKENDLKKYK